MYSRPLRSDCAILRPLSPACARSCNLARACTPGLRSPSGLLISPIARDTRAWSPVQCDRPPSPSVPKISPVFIAESVNLGVSRGKDGKFALRGGGAPMRGRGCLTRQRGSSKLTGETPFGRGALRVTRVQAPIGSPPLRVTLVSLGPWPSTLIASISETGDPLPRRRQLKAPAIGHVVGHLPRRNVVDDQGIGSMCVDPS